MNYWVKSLIGLAFLFFMLAMGYLQTQAPSALTDTDVDWGTPDGAPQRPVNSMPKPYHLSDSTVIFQTVVVD